MLFADRVRSLLGIGGVAAVTISAIGDFFAPRGGWMLTMLAGFIGLFLLLYALLCAPGKNKLTRLTGDTPENLAWWGGPRWKQHGIHVLAIFTGVCLLVGSKSYADASTGGILGSHVTMVWDAQQMTGLVQQSIEEQQKTRRQIETLTTVVKKETSSDPREELANLGVPWSMEHMEDSIRNSDARTLNLFLDGGMKFGNSEQAFFNMAFEKADPDVLHVLVTHEAAISPDLCAPASESSIGDAYLKDELAKDLAEGGDRYRALVQICSNPKVKALFQTAIDEELANKAKIDRGNASVTESRQACITRLRRDFPLEKLMTSANSAPSFTNSRSLTQGGIDSPEKLLKEAVFEHFVTPRTPGENDDSFYAKAVVDACNQSYYTVPYNASRLHLLQEAASRL